MTTETFTPEEAQQLLNDASDKYMQGEISDEEYEAALHRYSPDYRPAMLGLAQNLQESEASEPTLGESSDAAQLVLLVLALLLLIIISLPHLARLTKHDEVIEQAAA